VQTAYTTSLLLLLLQCELLDGGLDVLVATPGRLLSHLEKGSLSLQHTAALVMDEVDVLAGEKWNERWYKTPTLVVLVYLMASCCALLRA
jgi:hypothetical protein